MWKNRIRNKTIQNLSNFTVYLTISKNHVGKYIFCKSEDIKNLLDYALIILI
jgi:hypothetical protein